MDKQAILTELQNQPQKSLKEIPLGEGAGAEVWRNWDVWVLFEIPQYGGEGRLWGCYTKDFLEELVNVIASWT